MLGGERNDMKFRLGKKVDVILLRICGSRLMPSWIMAIFGLFVKLERPRSIHFLEVVRFPQFLVSAIRQ